jgi:hypothetical protein
MVTPPRRAAPQRPSPNEEPYIQGDPIPAPDAVEMNTETTWQLFADLEATENRRYADTAPMPIAGTLPGAGLDRPAIRPAAPTKTSVLDKALLEAKQGNRVCPRAAEWQQLYEFMVSRLPPGSGASVPRPLIGDAWLQTPALAKRMCFKDQLHWAASNGQIEEVYVFMKGLAESQWHHMGE